MSVQIPSLVDGMPDAQYHADPVDGGSLSSTGARILAKFPPAKYAAWRATPPAPRKVFDLGHAVHSLALGRGLGVVAYPEEVLSKSGTTGTDAARAFASDSRSKGLVPLKDSEYREVKAMTEAILAHPIAGGLFAGDGKPEQSLFWRDADSGVPCRARIDWMTPAGRDGRIINVDLKTTSALSPDDWDRDAGKHGYHQQAAHYEDGLLALTGAEASATVWVVVEKAPPYLVLLTQLPLVDIRRGQDLNARARRIYAECTRTGVWPGYPPDVRIGRIPTYLARTEEDILA